MPAHPPPPVNTIITSCSYVPTPPPAGNETGAPYITKVGFRTEKAVEDILNRKMELFYSQNFYLTFVNRDLTKEERDKEKDERQRRRGRGGRSDLTQATAGAGGGGRGDSQGVAGAVGATNGDIQQLLTESRNAVGDRQEENRQHQNERQNRETEPQTADREHVENVDRFEESSEPQTADREQAENTNTLEGSPVRAETETVGQAEATDNLDRSSMEINSREERENEIRPSGNRQDTMEILGE